MKLSFFLIISINLLQPHDKSVVYNSFPFFDGGAVIFEEKNSTNNKLETNDGNHIVLRSDKSFEKQIRRSNTTYEIQHDFDLNGSTVTVPKGCVFVFNGGSLNNGTLHFKSDTSLFKDIRSHNLVIDFDYSNIEVVGGRMIFDNLNNPILGYNSSSLRMSNVTLEGSVFGSFINIYTHAKDVRLDDTKDVFCVIQSCTITGVVNKGLFKSNTICHALRLVGAEMTDHTCYCNINNTIIHVAGNPYSCISWDKVEVIGGDFTGGEGMAPNLYGNQSASIIGGYYHDMKRGATIGGKVGHFATVSNTVNKNLSGMGISIDMARSTTPETYSDGYVAVVGNIVDNARYGIYIQGTHVSISNNLLRGGPLSSNYGIRINNLENKDDDVISVTNNIIDYSGLNVYPIFLGENASAYVKDNICFSNNYSINAGTAGAKLHQYQRLVIDSDIVSRNVDLVQQYDIVYIDNSVTQSFVLRISPASAIPNKTIRIYNNSDHTVTLQPKSNSNVVINGNNRIQGKSCTLIDCLDANTLFVTHMSSFNDGNPSTRPANCSIGHMYFDTDLGKPIFWNGKNWVDALGLKVDN